MMTDRGGA